MELVTTILLYWGIASGITTLLIGLWCWRKIQYQNKMERLRHQLGYRANLRGWSDLRER
jgi:hypothetical protein